MPIQPNDRLHQHPTRLWRAAEAAADVPAQARYRMIRTAGGLSWAALNELPVGSFSRHGLNTR
ncbi:DNA repair protein [Micromonospora sp. DT4]|uniref:DNA repair protein n=1 Tax=unclassified Micromonospora TaxID=2617518 RepID=UPI0033A1832C